MNGLPKYVASTTLQEPLAWNNSRLTQGEVAEEVSKLKQQPGRDILIYGSGELVRWLGEHHLIDKYRLLVYPVVLGSGKQLFRDGSKMPLRPVETRALSSGVVLLSYQPDSKA